MGDEEREVVGEIVASGLSVARWCATTGRMGTTKAYRILNWFRENDPSAFGAGEEAAREPGGGAWFERVRAAAEAAAESEIEDVAEAGGCGRAPAAAAGTVATGAVAAASASVPRAVATGSLALVDATGLLAAPPARASPAITVEAMGVTVTLPAGSAYADVSSAVSATLAALGVAG